MELFTNALLITLGAFTAVAFAWSLSKVGKMVFWVWVDKRRQALNEAVAEERAARAARAKEHFNSLALAALENSDVKEILEALRAVPYVDARTKAAKKQNYERSKIQAKLRKLVVDANVRNAIYDMAA